jgi:hypothetical protein
MAYNTSKGDRELGDIKNEADPDTQIDFGNDTLTFKTDDTGRLFVTNTHVSCSVILSASVFYGDGSWLQGVTGSGGTMSSFTLSGDGGPNQTILNSDTVEIAGGTGLSTLASATDTVTINLDDTSVTAGSYTYASLTVDDQGRLTAASDGAAPGDASGPGSSTDNAIARYDGAGGKTLQNSSVTIDDAGNISAGSAQISVNSAVVGGGGVSSTGTISGSGELTVKNNIVSQASVNVSGNANIAGLLTASQGISLTSDSQRLSVGSTGQFYVAHASNTILANQVGHLTFDVETGGKNARFILGDDAGLSAVQIRNNSNNNVAIIKSNGLISGSGELTVKGNVVTQGAMNVSGNAAIGTGGDDITTINSQLTASNGIKVTGFLTASQGISLTNDAQRLSVGSTGQFYVAHASNTILANQVGHLTFDVETSGKNLRFQLGDDAGASKVQFRNNSSNSVTSVDSAGVLATNAYGLNGIASGSISLNDIIVPVGNFSNVIKFAKASPKTLSGSRGPFYISYEAAGDGASVTALKSRLITGIDTSPAQNVGDALYLSPVSSGSYVIGVPNPTADDAHFSLIIRVGRVLNVDASSGVVILEPPGSAGPLVGQVVAGGGTSTLVSGFGSAFSGSQGSCAVQATANTDPAPGDDDQIKSAFIRADGKLQITLDDSSGAPLLTYTIYA